MMMMVITIIIIEIIRIRIRIRVRIRIINTSVMTFRTPLISCMIYLITCLKPIGNYMYHSMQYTVTVFRHKVYLCAPYCCRTRS